MPNRKLVKLSTRLIFIYPGNLARDLHYKKKTTDMKTKEVKINGEMVPCENVLKIELVCVSDQLFREITYRKFDPCYHEIKAIVSADKGYEIEKKVRKACLRY